MLHKTYVWASKGAQETVPKDKYFFKVLFIFLKLSAENNDWPQALTKPLAVSFAPLFLLSH